MLSVIIPTLNSSDQLEGLLKSLNEADVVDEIIVSDGGSDDQTEILCTQNRARFITSPKGRGPQLSRGANTGIGDWMLFLHADSRLLPGWSAVIKNFIQNSHNTYRAAYFHFALETTDANARRVEKLANWRAKTLGLPYGDQGLLISRAFYDHLGGYRDVPIMEDVDLIRRIGKTRLDDLPLALLTGAERYEKDGYLMRPLRNLLCLGSYFAGVSPITIKRFYD